MSHPAFAPGAVAVITGAASGIGLAATRYLLHIGMRVCMADLDSDRLTAVRDRLIGAGVDARHVMIHPTDVSDKAQLLTLADAAFMAFGTVNVLMNNAGMQPGSSIFDPWGNWDQILDVNLFGVIRGTQIFAPRMIAAGAPGLIINTGSKQGLTTPPGDPAYNLSKAGVKVFTEALQHTLRNTPNCKVDARLFMPGFVYTRLTAHGRTEKPAGAWTPQQAVEFLFQAIDNGDFYILCPDNEVDRELDQKRILWSAGDIAENRPPLSRWHPDYAELFNQWLVPPSSSKKTVTSFE
jgi:NAD(P)-dependent dehydrogenase (short-subunit alcohol dehydrogenase family)